MKKSYDIAVIGGGASGLAAAITSARMAEGASVAVFEKKRNHGQKTQCGRKRQMQYLKCWVRIFGAGYGLLRQCRNFPA